MELPGEKFHQHVITDESQLDQNGPDPFPTMLLFFQGTGELLGFDQAFLE